MSVDGQFETPDFGGKAYSGHGLPHVFDARELQLSRPENPRLSGFCVSGAVSCEWPDRRENSGAGFPPMLRPLGDAPPFGKGAAGAFSGRGWAILVRRGSKFFDIRVFLGAIRYIYISIAYCILVMI
jgi:hypothetical protein